MSGPSERIRNDLRRADHWAGLDPCKRVVESLDNHDEFGFFWHRISELAERFGEIGVPVRRVTGGTLVAMIARTARYRGERDELQGLRGGGRDDQARLAVSRASVRYAPSDRREWPPRSHPRPSSSGYIRPS